MNQIESVDYFVEKYDLPKGLALGVLRDIDDCKNFYIFYYQKNKNLADDLFDYKLDKIEEENVSQAEFIDMCKDSSDIQDVFEKVFLQRFSSYDMDIIHSKIYNNSNLLNFIFTSFAKSPLKNIMRYVL